MQEDHSQTDAHVPAAAAFRGPMPTKTPPAVIPHDCLLPRYKEAFTVAKSARWAYQGRGGCLGDLKEHRRAGFTIHCGMLGFRVT